MTITLSIFEIRDLILMSLVLGVIFKDLIPMNLLFKPKNSDSSYGLNQVGNIYNYKPKSFLDKLKGYFDYNYWFSMIVIAPAIVLHELSHKVVAQYLGLNATFHAAYNFLAFALVMKIVFPLFIFFVPGYVSSYCTQAGPSCIMSSVSNSLVPSAKASAMIAFGGPFANLLLYLIASFLLSHYYSTNILNANSLRSKKDKAIMLALIITKKINLFLFVLNMLPVPGFDGFHVYYNLYHMFF